MDFGFLWNKRKIWPLRPTGIHNYCLRELRSSCCPLPQSPPLLTTSPAVKPDTEPALVFHLYPASGPFGSHRLHDLCVTTRGGGSGQ